MSRADRWWRPTSRRPAVRARSRMYRYNEYDVNLAYDRGVMRGSKDTAERNKRRDDLLFRLARAAEEGPEAVEQLARELDQEDDDIDGLAREVGVLDGEEDKALWDSVPAALTDDPERLLAEVERWLREGGGE